MKFLHCVMLTFDESRGGQGIIDDVAKLFIGNGVLPLRRNHEADTSDGSYKLTGKNWLMNLGDIPSIPTALERSHACRWRGTFMRGEMTDKPSEVDVAKKKFLVDSDGKQFMVGGDAVWSFYHDFLFKYMRQTGPALWRKTLEKSSEDTKWLLRKMARVATTSSPDEPEPGEQKDGTAMASQLAHDIVTETHAAIKRAVFSALRC